jgi:hypothetical protein
MKTYVELEDVVVEYEVDHPKVTVEGVWLAAEGKPDIEITDYLTLYSRDQCEQRAIEDYEAKCQDAQEAREDR